MTSTTTTIRCRSPLGLTNPTTSPLRMAARDTAAVAAGMVAFGVALGVTIVVFGSSRLAGLLGGALVYGGSAQLTALSMLHARAPIMAATLTAAIVNLRLLLYSASLAERFREQPTWFRWLAPYFIIDQTYLMASTRPELAGRAFRRYWNWLGLLVLLVWLGSISLGMVAGPYLPPLPHLGLVGTALFIGLLVPRLTTRPAIVAALAGGTTAVCVSLVAPSIAIIAGAVGGLLAAVRSSGPDIKREHR